MSQSNFLNYNDFIKNNSYINLDDGDHIGIIWSCNNAVKTHNVNIFHKNNSNSLEENDEEENESINIELRE